MKQDWKSTTWGEIATLEYGKGLGGYETSDGDYPVYGTNGMIGWNNEPLVQNEGIIIGRKGAYRGVHYSKRPFYVIDTAFYLQPKVELIPRWAYYQLLTQDINSMDSGSAIPSTSRQDFYALQVKLPPVPEQRAIAGMLGALDDKIELNNRMNQTLESIAWAMFHHWFMESDGAKIREEKSLDEIANFLNGLALQKFPAEGDEYLPVIKIAQLRKNETKDSDKAGTNIPPEYIIEDGDILFSWSGSLEVVVWCGGKGALNQHLFKVTSKKYPKWFYYFWTKYHLPEFQAIAAGKATTMGHIQRHHLTGAKVLIPSDKELQEMDKMMSPILDVIISNEKQSRKLADLRNTLLPQLIRGDVRVNAE